MAPDTDSSWRKRLAADTPITPAEADVLRAARDNRGSVADIPRSWTATVAALVIADLLEIDVVGFRMTSAGDILLAEFEERELAGRPPTP